MESKHLLNTRPQMFNSTPKYSDCIFVLKLKSSNTLAPFFMRFILLFLCWNFEKGNTDFIVKCFLYFFKSSLYDYFKMSLTCKRNKLWSPFSFIKIHRNMNLHLFWIQLFVWWIVAWTYFKHRILFIRVALFIEKR